MKKKYHYIGIVGLLGVALTWILWYYCSTSFFIQIPIKIDYFGAPLVKVKIEDDTYDLKLDLGSKFLLSLNKDILDKLNKIPLGVAQWLDAKGNTYSSPSYRIRDVEIEKLLLKKVDVKQENERYVENTVLWRNASIPSPKKLGAIGRPILEKINLLLDCSRLKIVATNSKRMLKEAGYDLDQMVKIPIEINKRGNIIKVDTDVGILNFVIDTGATITLVRSSILQKRECAQDDRGFLIYNSAKFVIGKNDFGMKKLYPYDITPEIKEVDGILGMDFLENHVVYFDYKNKAIFIENKVISN